MVKKICIGVAILALAVLGVCTWSYSAAKVQIVCIPATQHLNETKYLIIHTDTVATEPFLTLRIYYVARDTQYR
jgi:lipopolysaccharide export system protein LptC